MYYVKENFYFAFNKSWLSKKPYLKLIKTFKSLHYMFRVAFIQQKLIGHINFLNSFVQTISSSKEHTMLFGRVNLAQLKV